MEENRAYKVAIIGCGPKGLYGLERLLFELSSVELRQPVEVHIFNKSPFFGAGDIYRCDQPSYLLMNYSNRNINMWNHDSAIGPNQLSFVEWLKIRHPGNSDINTLTNGYSPRATVGTYLHEGYKQLKDYASDTIRIIEHLGEAHRIEPIGLNFSIEAKSLQDHKNYTVSQIENILLTTGHQKPVENHLNNNSSDSTINFIYPVQRKFRNILPSSKVAIKGMGLTFLDAALGLTEGRGGDFKALENGKLVYLPSGSEPACIYPFSRSGLPCFPRKGNSLSSHELRFFNKNYLEQSISPRPEFEEELWPVIFAEMKVAYYEVLFRQFQLAFDDIHDLVSLQKVINEFHVNYPDQQRFYWSTLVDPFKNTFKEKCHHSTMTKYIDGIINEAEKGVNNSPLAAAASVWSHMSKLFNEYYSFGGLSPDSQRLFHRDFSGHLNRISYGPPVINMKKIVALAEAGFIDFNYSSDPDVEFSNANNSWLLKSGSSPVISVDYLLDARIPKNNILKSGSELYANLLSQGLVRPFVNKNSVNAFRPGCIEINREGHPVNSTGEVEKQITVSGTPTEGITYDNDTLSRTRNDFVSSWAKSVKNTCQQINKLIEHEG